VIIVLLGAPGAGKGTQGDLLLEKYGFTKLSTGDVLREEIKRNTDIGKEIKQIMSSGALVPESVVNEIISTRLTLDVVKKGVILDGYPRNKVQLEFLLDYLGELGLENELVALNIVVDESELVIRLTGRRVCKSCGASYHVNFRPEQHTGICDRCGGEIVQRPDDNIDAVRNRLLVYRKETQPLLDEFSRLDNLESVSGMGSAEQVKAGIEKIIETKKEKPSEISAKC
jgi:adenylate kinase